MKRVTLLVAVVLTSLPWSVRAQGVDPRRLPRPVFGLVQASPDATRLNLTFDLSEALEDRLPPQFQQRGGRGDLRAGGLSTRLFAGADISRATRRIDIAALAATAVKYYEPLDLVTPISHNAFLATTVRLPGSTSVTASQGLAYSPSFLYQLFPGSTLPVGDVAIPTDPDYRLVRNPTYQARSALSMTVGATDGLQVTAGGQFGRTHFVRPLQGSQQRRDSYSGNVTIASSLGRNTALNIGYVYSQQAFGLSGRQEQHLLNLGMSYSRALSTSRRLTFSFRLLPSHIEAPDPTRGTGNQRVYRVQGEAGVVYPFRLNWRASATYRRGIETLAVLYEPVFTDAGTVELTGLMGRRTDLLVSGSYATGASAIRRNVRTLDTYTGRLRLRQALSRSLAVYSEYLYYYFDLRAIAALPDGMPMFFEQHSGRIGVMWFLDALGR